MLVQCPLSGAKYELRSVPGVVVDSFHPITAMPLSALNALRVPSDQTGAHLYLCAYLYKLYELELLRFGNVPIARWFSHQWIAQISGTLVRLANWIALNPTNGIVKTLPAFRLDSDTTATELQTWLDECMLIIDTRANSWASRNASEKIKALLGAGVPEERGDSFTAALDRELADQRLTRVPAITRGKYLIRWIHESFGNSVAINPQQFAQIKAVLRNPKEYPYPVLQRTKEFVLDFGLEITLEQKNEKDMVIAQLDELMVKKVGVAALLGNGSGHLNLKASDGPKATAVYTILSDIPTTPRTGAGSVPTIAAPDRLPMPADYPNRLAYSIALRKYMAAKTAKAAK